jgi:hypothetical protein
MDCCSSLQQLPGTISQLTALSSLLLRGCSSLQALSAIMQLTWLQELELQITAHYSGDCEPALHNISCFSRLFSLGLRSPDMQQLPDSICQLPTLSSLNLCGCSSLQRLPDTISQLAALTNLEMTSCISLQQLPDSIGQLTSLTSLQLSYCSGLRQLPSTIGQLTALRDLGMDGCFSLEQLPDTIGQLTVLADLIIS